MKTPKEEIIRRQKEYREIFDLYMKISEKISKLRLQEDSREKINKLLESPEYLDIENSLLSGPIYDLPEEDIGDSEYRDALGKHPFDSPKFRDLYSSGLPKGSECFAYDYSGYYIKINNKYYATGQ